MGSKRWAWRLLKNWLCSWDGVTLSPMSALCGEGKWAGKEKKEHEGENVEGMQVDKNHRITEWWRSAPLTSTSCFTSEYKVLEKWLCGLRENSGVHWSRECVSQAEHRAKVESLIVQSGTGAVSFCFSAFPCVLENSSWQLYIKSPALHLSLEQVLCRFSQKGVNISSEGQLPPVSS